jgi:transcriptional regulator GlxA family with amidase domain
VSDAEKVLRGHLDDPITIAALSQTVGVSERTLRNAFADVHRKSPKRYFLNQRLQSVRQALSDAGNKAATVTAVATDYGFYELGRFALQYRALFGESPSETLRRHRMSSPMSRAV